MISFKPIAKKVALIGLLIFLSYNSVVAQNGQQLFQANCQTCHAVDRVLVGPALGGLEGRGPWADHKELYKWVHNPGGYMATDSYTQGLKAQYGSMMQAFPALQPKEIDAIVDYINTTAAAKANAGSAPGSANANPAESTSSGNSALVFGVISLVLALIALVLMQVNSNLKKLSDDKEHIQRPEPVPFYRNKIYIAFVAILLFILAGYYIGQGAIGLGRQQGYQPVQPIHYSHKVHAGINQINCLYCHGNAWESKHAAIPSLNVCMNCHKAINTYEKGPKIYDENGNEINGTDEINKLYKYAGFTPGPGATWDASKARPVEWVKIHNLPDHVYFNHSQHIRAGKVQCQTCHGPIQEMDEVRQWAPLSMGWCINCHRETKVDFFNKKDSSGNKFYSIYEKFHNDIKNGKMDSVTVKDIGGIECQKCHY